MISEFDTDKNGTIEFEEFISLAEKMQTQEEEEDSLRSAFEVFVFI